MLPIQRKSAGHRWQTTKVIAARQTGARINNYEASEIKVLARNWKSLQIVCVNWSANMG
jgi:hypothetical protein